MKKLLSTIAVFLIAIGTFTPAYAYQSGFGLAAMDLGSFDYSYEYANDGNGSGGVSFSKVGVYSAGYAFAYDEYGYDADGFYSYVVDDWAEAYTSGSLALSIADGDVIGSIAEAEAGNGLGEESAAFAGSFVAAYGFKATADIWLTVQMDYYLEGGVEGEGLGYSSAGSGAFLAIYENYAGFSVNGDWQGAMNRYDDEIEAYLVDDDTLYASLYLSAGDYFTLFAGTLAYAYAKETEPVPEPATMFLLGAGLIGIAGLGRMRFSKQ